MTAASPSLLFNLNSPTSNTAIPLSLAESKSGVAVNSHLPLAIPLSLAASDTERCAVLQLWLRVWHLISVCALRCQRQAFVSEATHIRDCCRGCTSHCECGCCVRYYGRGRKVQKTITRCGCPRSLLSDTAVRQRPLLSDRDLPCQTQLSDTAVRHSCRTETSLVTQRPPLSDTAIRQRPRQGGEQNPFP